MRLSGLELIKAYRNYPERYLPVPDRTGQTPSVNEYGEHNIGWNAGLLEDNRPYFVECWAVDHITMLTFYCSTGGLKDRSKSELMQILLDTGYFRFVNDEERSCELSTFSDSEGNEFFSINITAGIDEDPPLIKGAPLISWSVLNEYNKTEEMKREELFSTWPAHIKIWLDDVREAPEGYFRCKSVNEAKRLISACEDEATVIDVIDCDHDLGDYAADGGDGISLIDWLAERGTHYPIEIHTMNPVGREKMQREIDRYWNER